ncbi:MAG: hypothetical protein GXY08_14945 [Ruminococcus sp.]|nr:hypothetical protein [Ruminococcus sp.]
MFGRKKNSFDSSWGTNYETTVSGVEKITKKRKGRKIAAISGVSAAVLVGSGIAAYNLSPFVKNQVRLRVMKPKNYYAWIYEENGKELAKRLSESYDTHLTRFENGQHSNVSIDYEPTAEALQKFHEKYVDDGKELDEEDRRFLDVVDKTDKLGIALDTYSKNGNIQFSASGSRNDQALLSFDMMLAGGEGDIFARVPQLTEQWLGFSLDEWMGDDPDAKKIRDAYYEVISDPRSFLSPDELEDEILRYVGVWNDTVEKVRLKNSEEVEINDITVKYTVATVRIDDEMMCDIANNFAESAKDDDIIRGIVVDKLGVATDEEYDEFFDELIDDINEDFDSSEEEEKDPLEEKPAISFRTYIDPTGVIRGFEIKEDADNSFRAVVGKKGDEVCGEVVLMDDGSPEFEADLYAEETSKDVYSGSIEFIDHTREYDFDLDDYIEKAEKYTVEFEDFSIENDERKYFNADVTIIMPDEDPIEIEFEADSDHQSIIYEIVVDDVDYGKLTVSWSTEEEADIDIPSREDSFMIDKNNRSKQSLKQYVDRDHMKNFIKELLVKLDIDDKNADELAEDAASRIYDDIDEVYDEIDEFSERETRNRIL